MVTKTKSSGKSRVGKVVKSSRLPEGIPIPEGNGGAFGRKRKKISVPQLVIAETVITIKGTNPLLVNNKMGIAQSVAERYGGQGGKTKSVDTIPTVEQAYAMAFYKMADTKFEPPSPKGRYGIPASGIKKCICSAIRTAGFTDNTEIGLVGKSFWVMADSIGLCLIKFKKLERDIRPVNIGSGQKTVPQMRHRPMFHDWSCDLRIRYNPGVLGPESMVNLIMHAGQYIGLCELRAEKKQGECGGFVVANN